MPKGRKPNAATPAPNTPAATAKPGTTIDLSKYARVGDAPSPSAGGAAPKGSGTSQRANRPRVKYSELVGIDGLRMKDAFEDASDFGPYVGATVVLPDGVEAFAMASVSTSAGRALQAKVDSGAFDNGAVLGFTVSARLTPATPEWQAEHPGEKKKPRLTVRFPAGA